MSFHCVFKVYTTHLNVCYIYKYICKLYSTVYMRNKFSKWTNWRIQQDQIFSEKQTFNHLVPALFLLSREKANKRSLSGHYFQQTYFNPFLPETTKHSAKAVTFPLLMAAVTSAGAYDDTVLETNSRHVMTEHRVDGSTVGP